MSKLPVLKLYRKDLDLLRRAREETLRLIEDLSEAQFQFSPAGRLQAFELPFLPLRALSPQKHRWSISEVADHLLLFETVFRNDISRIIQLKRSGQDPLLRLGFREINVSFAFIPRIFLPLLEVPVGTFSQVMPNTVVEFLTTNRLLPAQNPDVAAPRKGRRKAELIQDLKDSLEASEQLFSDNPELDYREMFRQHPTTGRQNVLEALRMIALHEQRHHNQIREVLVDPKFPR